MRQPKRRSWTVTIHVKSVTRPEVRVLCGDTIFLRLDEGQSATWSLRGEKQERLDNARQS